MDRKKEIEELRRVMGTLPSQSPDLKTKFYRGVEGIKVDLVDYNRNPYKAMYIIATTCWGNKVNKWSETSPEGRFLVVKSVLEGQALPLALEVPHFTFVIEGPSRAAFDQFARTRIGAVFSAKGMRDNNWKDCDIRIPNALWPNMNDSVQKKLTFEHIINIMKQVKETYSEIVDYGKGSWQAARAVLPLYVCYGWSVSYTYAALRGVCANRMKFCEMEDTTGTAWLMAREVCKRFPLLGSYLRPGCDFTHKCQYHRSYTLSEMFGCLFKECGRNPCETSDEYAEFNEVCTSKNLLEEQLNIAIPEPDEWPAYNCYGDLSPLDQTLFEEG